MTKKKSSLLLTKGTNQLCVRMNWVTFMFSNFKMLGIICALIFFFLVVEERKKRKKKE